MKRTCPIIVVLVVMLSFTPAGGGAPPYVPLQGVLTDPQGVPVQGEVEVLFSIYDAQAGEDPLWSEAQTILVENGLFAVYLGQVNTLQLSMFRDNGDLWLGISVGADSEMPRMYLGSTPFSGYAEYTGNDTLSALTCSNWQVVKWNGSAWACASDNDTNNDTLAGLSCANAQVAKWNVVEWECADDLDTDTDTDTLAGLSCAGGQLAKWNGSAWGCANDVDTDTDTLADLSCGNGQVAKWNGSAWACANDANTNTDTLANLNCTAGEVAMFNGSSWECAQMVTWTSVDISLGTLNFTPGTISYDIPPAIPAGAREILVFFYVRKGGNDTPIGQRTWKIYTQEGSDIYYKKIVMFPWPNQAITYNSDNQWLPITSQRQIHIQETGGDVGGDYSGWIYIIGYR